MGGIERLRFSLGKPVWSLSSSTHRLHSVMYDADTMEHMIKVSDLQNGLQLTPHLSLEK